MGITVLDIKHRILHKLIRWNKWGGSHTENILGGLPGHLKGSKIVDQALKELVLDEWLSREENGGDSLLAQFEEGGGDTGVLWGVL